MAAIYSKLLLALMIFSFFLEPSVKHPLHVSTTEIEFNSKEKNLEISCRIYTDDFETVLAKQFKTKVDLNKPAMHKAMDELVKKYMNTNLQYKINGKNLTATYVGFERDNEATNVYLEIENVTSLQSLSLSNSILYDLFDDQMNILHAVKAGTRKSVRANYPNKGLNVTF
ncbi:DUF6702 family protein [Pedobacter frigiditerrae]|uniref:DUF6702 family protein n=1 Tax=Pedobacter frigiditerrae TaxID=2530452 RepID=UPI002930184A|nr:DUF6702 family protein [Pedobacter frigiditerrae]